MWWIYAHVYGVAVDSPHPPPLICICVRVNLTPQVIHSNMGRSLHLGLKAQEVVVVCMAVTQQLHRRRCRTCDEVLPTPLLCHTWERVCTVHC